MQKKITLFVVSVHLLMILMLLFSPPKIKPLKSKHIAVRTLQPKTRAATAAVSPTPKKRASPPAAAKPQNPPKAAAKAVPKKETAKKEAPKKETKTAAASKPAPIKSKPINQKKPSVVEKGKPKKTVKPKQEVWQEIDEALAKIDHKVYSKSQSKLDVPQVKGSTPSFLPVPDFGDLEDGEEGTDEETLISFLHTSLNLPEFGEVKIQLTVKKDGSVSRLVVLEAQSQKNRAYLEKHLTLLKFPIIFDKEKTFTLTFCNEI